MTGRQFLATVAIAFLITFGGILGYAIYVSITTDKTSEITTSIASPKPAAPREVKSVLTDSAGDLLITYTDGTVQNAGRVVGRDGNGQAPTQSQISAALIEYCANGRCDSKAPTQQQIIDALNIYCANGVCRGPAGAAAVPITGDQIAAAVASYCSTGVCRGEDGQSVKGDKGDQGDPGATGANGESTLISCVSRSTTRFVAWKYVSEPDQSYRDLYKLPIWAECTNPIAIS